LNRGGLSCDDRIEPEAAMIDAKNQNIADAQFTREISDDELDNVTAGVRKAGGEQQEFLTVSSPPSPIETVIGWIKGLFN
jgi:hypothetical protein